MKDKKTQSIQKVYRYYKIYGLSRALNKVSGRLRSFNFFKPRFIFSRPFIGLIGCGQFQFSTIAYFLSKSLTNKFLFCYDIEQKNAITLATYYSVPSVITNSNEILDIENTKLVYIASNHATHTEYAIKYLEKNITTYCEKPISVSFEQFDSLLEVIKKSKAKFFAGYNRPYSPAIKEIGKKIKSKKNNNGKFSINCFITAHDIPETHWYRNPEEGTRVCGNVGHWLDLMIHMYNWRGYIPQAFTIQIAYSNIDEPDDNIAISLTTPEGDITSIMITARSEPFEGINETINFQYDTIIAKIDDFRKLTIWDVEELCTKKYRPKDVGHKRSILQPFKKDNRDLNEVIASTELMLNITKMVRNRVTEQKIGLTRSL
jgi:predicted dehydrogenase